MINFENLKLEIEFGKLLYVYDNHKKHNALSSENDSLEDFLETVMGKRAVYQKDQNGEIYCSLENIESRCTDRGIRVLNGSNEIEINFELYEAFLDYLICFDYENKTQDSFTFFDSIAECIDPNVANLVIEKNENGIDYCYVEDICGNPYVYDGDFQVELHDEGLEEYLMEYLNLINEQFNTYDNYPLHEYLMDEYQIECVVETDSKGVEHYYIAS